MTKNKPTYFQGRRIFADQDYVLLVCFVSNWFIGVARNTRLAPKPTPLVLCGLVPWRGVAAAWRGVVLRFEDFRWTNLVLA